MALAASGTCTHARRYGPLWRSKPVGARLHRRCLPPGRVLQRKSIRKWFFPDQQKATDATNQFCRHVQLVQVPSNTLIYAQEDAAASVFAVVGGAVELLRQEAPAVDTRQPPRRGTSAKAATVGNRRDSVLGIVPIPVVPELRLGSSNAAPASAADSASGGVLRTTSVGATLWGKTASLGSMGPLIAESQAPGAGAAKPTLPGTSEAAASAGAASAGDVVDAAAAGLGESAALLRPGDVFGQPLPTFHAMSQQFEPAFAHGTADNSAVRRRGESAVSRPSGAHSHASHRHSKPGRQTTLLRVPAEQYAATPVGEAYLRAEARRLNHLSKLVVFRGWPVVELEFLARWMQDVKLAPVRVLASGWAWHSGAGVVRGSALTCTPRCFRCSRGARVMLRSTWGTT